MADETRIHSLLAQMTRDEKAALTAGSGLWWGSPIPRLGVPRLKLTDGPIGARGGNFGGGLSAACFPSASAISSSWNPELVQAIGTALGEEARTKQAHVLLGPTVNMHRSPLGGRHFETYSEDPVLTARLAVAFVRGVQSQHVAVSVKHFVANDSEFERHTINSLVSERALREIYLVPFEAAVRDAGAWTIMGAYNAVNGPPACAHHELLRTILKEEWGFDGLVVSDWFALKDTEGPGAGGLDLEMPGPARHFGPALAEAVEKGVVPERELDDKALRILRIMERTGALDAPDAEPEEQAVDREDHRALARRAATEGLVLLRNERGVLPLDDPAIRRVAVIGPNAAVTCLQGGGSARVEPHYETHALDSLREAFGDRALVVHEPGCTSWRSLPVLDGDAVEPPAEAGFDADKRGFEASFYGTSSFDGEPVSTRRMRKVDLLWMGEVGEGIDPRDFSLRLRGHFHPAEDGAHLFGLTCAGRARLFVDGELVVDNWSEQTRGDSFFGTGTHEEMGRTELRAGRPAELVLEYSCEGAVAMAGVKLGHHGPIPDDLLERAVGAAADADAAVVVVGLNAEWETEGHDKQDMHLPGRQEELIERVAAANPRTAVVVNAGAPLLVDWEERVPAILWAWYGGQEAGRAIADAVTGAASPSGKLPTTFPRRMEDVPCHTGDPKVYPGAGGEVRYEEDLWVGHRHYEAHDLAPRFPFGFGLSYTTFEIEDAALAAPASTLDEPLAVDVSVRNTGTRDGQEVVQLYVHPRAPRLPRPLQELKAFAKLPLAAGERGSVRLELDRRAFSVWDPGAHDWVVDPGAYEIRVGTSSADLPFRLAFEVRG